MKRIESSRPRATSRPHPVCLLGSLKNFWLITSMDSQGTEPENESLVLKGLGGQRDAQGTVGRTGTFHFGPAMARVTLTLWSPRPGPGKEFAGSLWESGSFNSMLIKENPRWQSETS